MLRHPGLAGKRASLTKNNEGSEFTLQISSVNGREVCSIGCATIVANEIKTKIDALKVAQSTWSMRPKIGDKHEK